MARPGAFVARHAKSISGVILLELCGCEWSTGCRSASGTIRTISVCLTSRAGYSE